MTGMTPQRLAEARAVITSSCTTFAVIAQAVLAERDYYAAEVARLRAQVEEYAVRCDSWADANDPIAAQGGWQASGYMKAYRRVAEDLRALTDGEATP